jgi:sugar phosphate isomerase/epimerase
VETYVNNVIGTIDATLRLFRDISSPHLGLVMDPTNYYEDHNIDDMDGVLRRMFAELSPYIKIAHAKDVASGPFIH